MGSFKYAEEGNSDGAEFIILAFNVSRVDKWNHAGSQENGFCGTTLPLTRETDAQKDTSKCVKNMIKKKEKDKNTFH